jgi:hypothetical protein
MKIETLVGLGLIGVLVWQISKRGNSTTYVTNQPMERGTRWEDVAVQGIQTVGEVAGVAIQNSRADARDDAACRANARSQVAAAQDAGVEVQGGDWNAIEEQIFQACSAGIS